MLFRAGKPITDDQFRKLAVARDQLFAVFEETVRADISLRASQSRTNDILSRAELNSALDPSDELHAFATQKNRQFLMDREFISQLTRKSVREGQISVVVRVNGAGQIIPGGSDSIILHIDAKTLLVRGVEVPEGVSDQASAVLRSAVLDYNDLAIDPARKAIYERFISRGRLSAADLDELLRVVHDLPDFSEESFGRLVDELDFNGLSISDPEVSAAADQFLHLEIVRRGHIQARDGVTNLQSPLGTPQYRSSFASNPCPAAALAADAIRTPTGLGVGMPCPFLPPAVRSAIDPLVARIEAVGGRVRHDGQQFVIEFPDSLDELAQERFVEGLDVKEILVGAGHRVDIRDVDAVAGRDANGNLLPTSKRALVDPPADARRLSVEEQQALVQGEEEADVIQPGVGLVYEDVTPAKATETRPLNPRALRELAGQIPCVGGAIAGLSGGVPCDVDSRLDEIGDLGSLDNAVDDLPVSISNDVEEEIVGLSSNQRVETAKQVRELKEQGRTQFALFTREGKSIPVEQTVRLRGKPPFQLAFYELTDPVTGVFLASNSYTIDGSVISSINIFVEQEVRGLGVNNIFFEQMTKMHPEVKTIEASLINSNEEAYINALLGSSEEVGSQAVHNTPFDKAMRKAGWEIDVEHSDLPSLTRKDLPDGTVEFGVERTIDVRYNRKVEATVANRQVLEDVLEEARRRANLGGDAEAEVLVAMYEQKLAELADFEQYGKRTLLEQFLDLLTFDDVPQAPTIEPASDLEMRLIEEASMAVQVE